MNKSPTRMISLRIPEEEYAALEAFISAGSAPCDLCGRTHRGQGRSEFVRDAIATVIRAGERALKAE